MSSGFSGTMSLLRFHLCVDAITNHILKSIYGHNLVLRNIYSFLAMDATQEILHLSRNLLPHCRFLTCQQKQNLACFPVSVYHMILGCRNWAYVHLHLGNDFLQFHNQDYSILSAA